MLEPLAIDGPDLLMNITDQLWMVVESLGVVENVAKIVAGTKTLHHLLPDLVVPMDRAWTGSSSSSICLSGRIRKASGRSSRSPTTTLPCRCTAGAPRAVCDRRRVAHQPNQGHRQRVDRLL
jgi:hypothetical protein